MTFEIYNSDLPPVISEAPIAVSSGPGLIEGVFQDATATIAKESAKETLKQLAEQLKEGGKVVLIGAAVVGAAYGGYRIISHYWNKGSTNHTVHDVAHPPEPKLVIQLENGEKVELAPIAGNSVRFGKDGAEVNSINID